MVLDFSLIEFVFILAMILPLLGKSLSISFYAMNTLFFSMMVLEHFSLSSFFFLDFFSKQMLFLLSWLMMTIMIFLENLKVKLFLLNFIAFVCTFYFVSKSSFVLFILFELSIFPILLLILGWGIQPERIQAGFFMLMYTLLCSSPLLLMISFSLSWGESYLMWTSNYLEVPFSLFDSPMSVFFFLLGFLSKVPIFFAHVWLPKAHVEATLEGSIILAGILLKLGVFGVIRFFQLFVFLLSKSFILVISVSMVGLLLGAFAAFAADDAKMIIAYASVSHMNVLLFALFTQKTLAKDSAIITAFSHGLSSSLLFFNLYIIYNVSHSRSMLLNKGVCGIFPILLLIMFLGWALNLSVPPSLGFWGEVFSMFSCLSFLPEGLLVLMLYFMISSSYSIFSFGVLTHSENSSYFKGMSTYLKDIFGCSFLCFPLFFFFYNFC